MLEELLIIYCIFSNSLSEVVRCQCKRQCSMVECITVQHSTVQCNTVYEIPVQFSIVHYSAVQCSTVQCSTVQCSTLQCSIVLCNAMLQWPHYWDRGGYPLGWISSRVKYPVANVTTSFSCCSLEDFFLTAGMSPGFPSSLPGPGNSPGPAGSSGRGR